METPRRVACMSRYDAWKSILRTLSPAFSDKVVAMGDACVAAVHYGDCYEGMEDFSFGMLRCDYESSLDSVVDAAERGGLVVDAYVTLTDKRMRKPFARFGKRLEGPSDEIAWLTLYPLDALPQQVILRFKLFGEAARLMARYFSMEESGDYIGYPNLSDELYGLRRFESCKTGLYSCLCGRFLGKRMGERTVFQRTLDVGDLFPVRLLSLGGVAIPVSRKVSNWTLEMTPQRKKAIEVIQKESLESLEEVDRVCGELGTDYFLVGGSMLGAVRHRGFIPWDDDTDVGMLRRDYARFCRKAGSVLGNGYFIQLPSTDKHIHFVYARLRKTGVDYITHYNEDKDFNKGIWVDLFPFDARPKSEVLARVQRIAANTFARASMGFKRRREYVEADMRLETDGVPKEDRAYLKAYYVASRLFPVRLCELAYHCAARMFNPFLAGKPDSLYASFIPSYTVISEEEIHPLNRVEYESANLLIPRGASAFLARQYGDYETIPRVHERYAEHGFKCLKTADGEIIGV